MPKPFSDSIVSGCTAHPKETQEVSCERLRFTHLQGVTAGPLLYSLIFTVTQGLVHQT